CGSRSPPPTGRVSTGAPGTSGSARPPSRRQAGVRPLDRAGPACGSPAPAARWRRALLTRSWTCRCLCRRLPDRRRRDGDCEPVTGVRSLVVWCPDWPVVAAGVPLDVPAAVLRANRVVACSPAARVEGVAVHQRRRDAQARCPELVVLDHDPAAEARAFEPVPAALEALTPRIEITRPGTCAFPTRGPSRYHGGDEALAHLAAARAAEALG